MFQMLDVDIYGGMEHLTILMWMTIHFNRLAGLEFTIFTIFEQILCLNTFFFRGGGIKY